MFYIVSEIYSFFAYICPLFFFISIQVFYIILTSFINQEFKNNLNWERIQNEPTSIHRSQQYPNRNPPQVKLIRLLKNQVFYKKKQNPGLQCRWPLKIIVAIPLSSKYFPLDIQENSHNSIYWLHWPPTIRETLNWLSITSNFFMKTPSFPPNPTTTTSSLPFIYSFSYPHTKTKNSMQKSKLCTSTTSKTSTSHTSCYSTMPFNKVHISLNKGNYRRVFQLKKDSPLNYFSPFLNRIS